MHAQPIIHRLTAARAFTAMEVVLALAVTGIIAVCVLSMVSASTNVWRQEAEAVAGTTAGMRPQSYLERTLSASHDVGYWAGGEGADPPALLLWAHDLRSKLESEVRDHQIQSCELLLVHYDSAGRTLRLYIPVEWSSMTTAEQTEAGEVLTAASFAAKATADAFMSRSWVQMRVLAGAAQNEQVTAMWVNVDRTSPNPVVRFRLTLTRDGRQHVIYNAVRLRVPSASDDWSPLILQNAPPDDDDGGNPF